MLDDLGLGSGLWSIASELVGGVAALGGVLVACWREFGRRFGALTVVSTWTALVVAAASARQLWAVQAVVVTVFWLFDRGVPGNRHRPAWLRVLAGILVVTALAAGVVGFDPSLIG